MRFPRFAVFGLVLFAAACAGGGGGGGGAGEGASSQQDRFLITATELADYGTYNLYETVRRARRFWLQGSGGMSPKVFVNGTELGGGPSLQEYMAGQAAKLEFIQGNVAMTQYGPDYAGGIIQVTLR